MTDETREVPTYESIGVRPLINCTGTVTVLSGSLILPEVRQAMAEASQRYVVIEELMEAVGARTSELMRCDWALVTCGCAAALTQVTAACVTGADPDKIGRLPDTEGMRNEVLVQPAHRHGYDQAIRTVGIRMIEVTTLHDLESAITDRTAMFAFLGDAADRGDISLQEMARVGREHAIPTFVDAAAERPDVPNRYLDEGADVVAYSGGKCLRGPQSSGLVLGRRDLLDAAFMNGAPHGSIGRPMKAGKEEIMGLLAAVEQWVVRDHQAEWRDWERRLAAIAEAAADIPSTSTQVERPGRSNVAPTMTISWDPQVAGITPEEARQQLSDGDPRIEVPAHPKGLTIMPYMMEPGEDAIVAARLLTLLRRASV